MYPMTYKLGFKTELHEAFINVSYEFNIYFSYKGMPKVKREFDNKLIHSFPDMLASDILLCYGKNPLSRYTLFC